MRVCIERRGTSELTFTSPFKQKTIDFAEFNEYDILFDPVKMCILEHVKAFHVFESSDEVVKKSIIFLYSKEDNLFSFSYGDDVFDLRAGKRSQIISVPF